MKNSAYSKEAAKRTGQEDASPLPRTQGYVPLSAAARRTSRMKEDTRVPVWERGSSSYRVLVLFFVTI